LGKPSLADWQAGTEQLTRERLEVVSMLGADGLGSLATTRAQALVDQDPQSSANQMLLARALAAAGRFAEAAKVHGDLFARNVRGPVFWREVAVLGANPGYTADPALLEAVTEACTSGDVLDSATTLAWGLEQLALALEKSGDPIKAGVVRFTRWQRAPRECKFSLTDAETIVTKLPASQAYPALGLVLGAIDPEQRAPVLEIAASVARELLSTSSDPLPEVYTTVSAWADRYGPFGCLVHCLLDHASRDYIALRPDDTRRMQLLLGHLQLIATGKDLSWLDKTMARLRQAQGNETTITDLETVLRQHPSALILWQERAQALARLHRVNGISDLRSVLAHASSPAANLAFATLAAAEHALLPGDAQLIEALPPALKTGADAKFARALASLRSGRPDEALALLEGAPTRADGLHLYATALALLQSTREDGAERARTALETLARDYASSSLARNAGTFASQLGPR
jgi:predicted Zn-dependent protease